MNKFKKISYSGILMLAAVSLCMILSACQGELKNDTAGENNSMGASAHDLVITLNSEGGLALEGVSVKAYADGELNDLEAVGRTDGDGKVTLKNVKTGYSLILEDVPSGYAFESKYSISDGITMEIILKTKLVEITDLSEMSFKKGDVMANFELSDGEGKTYRLSKLLENYEAVVINFWYNGCQPCKMEFPYLQKAYEAYSDKVAVLALDPVDGDNSSVEKFKDDNELTFPMMVCDSEWERAFGLLSYPTTVIIDRYGVIVSVHNGMITEEGVFEEMFRAVLGDDYKQGS